MKIKLNHNTLLTLLLAQIHINTKILHQSLFSSRLLFLNEPKIKKKKLYKRFNSSLTSLTHTIVNLIIFLVMVRCVLNLCFWQYFFIVFHLQGFFYQSVLTVLVYLYKGLLSISLFRTLLICSNYSHKSIKSREYRQLY